MRQAPNVFALKSATEFSRVFAYLSRIKKKYFAAKISHFITKLWWFAKCHRRSPQNCES
jgi:hypothetical protein